MFLPDWVRAGVFWFIFRLLKDDPDLETAMVHVTIVKFHGTGQGSTALVVKRRDLRRAVGVSTGG